MQPHSIVIQRFLFWEPRHPQAWRALCLGSVAIVAYLDFVLPQPLSLAVFYLPAIFIASWLWGRTFGAVIVLASLAGWLSDHLAVTTYPHPLYYAWDILIRLVTWIIFVWLVVELKAALLKADERFITLLKGWDSAVYVAETKSGAILYVNDRCKTDFGKGASLSHARQIDSRLTPIPQEVLPNEALKQANDNSTDRRLIECRDIETDHWYLVRAYMLRWVDGQMARMQIATDITEHKRMQMLARSQQERLELSSRLITLGGMASALAHELNQPLAAIINYNQGCVRLLRENRPDQAALLDAMEKSSAQAERAGKIIQRARALAQRREPELVPYDLNQIVTDNVGVIGLSAQRNRINLSLDLAPSLPRVRLDSVMIEQALLNLIRNATEAMLETPVERRALLISTAYNAQDNLVELRVADSGCGLPGAMDETLFIPFFTTKRDGLGLGLNLVRSIMELHGGRVWASRGIDVGTTFHLALPVSAHDR